MKITVNIPTAKILKSMGLGGSNEVRKYTASEVKRLCDPYVPFQQGALKNITTIATDGSALVYTQPYAHYQYYGEAMAGRAPKKYTGEALTYSGANRGKEWDKRMLADKRNDLERSVEAFIKKKGG